MTRIASGVTDQYIYFVGVDATDLKTRETGLSSFTVYRSRNGGAAAAMTTPTVNETDTTNMPGVYELLLDEDMTIDSGDETQEMVFHITASGMAPVTRTIELYRPKITAGNTLDVTATGAAGIDWGNIENKTTANDLSGTDIQLCDTVTTNTDMRGTDSAYTGTPPTAVAIADQVWDETQSTHTTAGSFGELATEIASILADTNELQTDDVPGLIAALNNISAADVNAQCDTAISDAALATAANLATVDTVVDAIKAVTDLLPNAGALTDLATAASITALNDVSTADINAQVLDVLNTDTFAELSSVPAAATTLTNMIRWIYLCASNELNQTATTATLRNRADSADIGTSTVSDDGTTAVRGSFS